MSAKPRVVIDTQIFLRAAINLRSLPAKILLDRMHEYQLVVSLPVANEISEVLHRTSIRAKFPDLNDEIINRILIRLENAEWVLIADIPAIGRDPKDDVFLATALAGSADYIVSEDKDLLVLNPYEGIQIVNVLEFVSVLETSESE